MTTYLGEFIPNGGFTQWYGFSVPIIHNWPGGVDVLKTTPPEFQHCLEGATHVAGRGPVRNGGPLCTEPREWPGVPLSYVGECQPPDC